MALLLHYTGQDYISRGLYQGNLTTQGSTATITNGNKTGKGWSFDGTTNSRLVFDSGFEVGTATTFSISFWIIKNSNALQLRPILIGHAGSRALVVVLRVDDLITIQRNTGAATTAFALNTPLPIYTLCVS